MTPPWRKTPERLPGHENVVLRLAAFALPRSEQFNDISRDIDLPRATILRTGQLAFGEATAHRDDGLHEINVTPGQRNELSLTHPGCSRRGYPPRRTGLRAHSPSDAVVEAMPL